MNDGAILISPGSTDVSLVVWLYNALTGALEIGLTETDLNMGYVRIEDDNDVTIQSVENCVALASPALTDPHLDKGCEEIGLGAYRIDVKDEAFAAGAIGGSIIITHDSGTVLTAKIDWQADPAVALCTTIADDNPDGSSTDSTFTLAAGSANDDEYNNMIITVKDISGGVISSRRITDYAQSTKKVTVDYPFEFAIAIGDIVTIWADTYSQTAGFAAVSEIADAVWDELQNDHLTQGTTGQRLQHSGRGRY